MNTFTEMEKLHQMLSKAAIPHSYKVLYDGLQIRMYADVEMTQELDDVIIHSGSHGYEQGLLETYCLNECEGHETAEQVFEGWQKMYRKALDKRA